MASQFDLAPRLAALDPYFGQLLKLDELKRALGVAEEVQTIVDATSVYGGWLLTTVKKVCRMFWTSYRKAEERPWKNN
jgi:hypothetical protein